MTIMTINAIESGSADVTAPSISSASASASGATGYTGSVSTDEANGTLFRYASTNASEPTAQVIASGQSQTVSVTGPQPVSGSGLSAQTTYYLHFVHRDAAGNESAVLSTNAFTTAAQGTGTGTVSIVLARATSPAVAPHGVHLTIGVSGASVAEPGNADLFDPTHEGLVYVTDWGDPGAPSDKVVNVPALWNDLNKTYGKHPSHTYTSPGTYTATTRVYELDGTFVGEDTLTTVVGNPDSEFPGNRTILVDTTGAGDSGTYPGSQVVNTINAAMTALKALNPTTGRILFRRGQTHDVTTQQVPKGDVGNYYLGAFGTGTRPVINLPQSNALRAGGSSVPDVLFALGDSFDRCAVFTDIRLQGPWNADTESGGQYRCIYATYEGDNRRLLVNNTEISGWSWGVGGLGGGSGETGIWINNCDITNWGDYGVWMSKNDNLYVSIVGTAIAQSQNALMNGDSKSWTKNHHGPIRMANIYRASFSVLDLFSRNGWTSNAGDFGRRPTSQPCMRLVTDGDNQSIQPHLTIERCAMEGGYSIVQLKHENVDFNGTKTDTNALFDKVLMVGTTCTWQVFELGYSGMTVRNTLVIIPDMPTKNDQWKGFFHPFGTDFNRIDTSPVRFYSNTFINLKSVANFDGDASNVDENLNASAGIPLSTDYIRTNDAVYQPNGSINHENIDVDLSTAITTVGGTWTSRFLGLRWSATATFSAQMTMDTSYASPAGFVTTATPNASSPLVGDATGALQPYDDFFGVVRSGSDRGAVER